MQRSKIVRVLGLLLVTGGAALAQVGEYANNLATDDEGVNIDPDFTIEALGFVTVFDSDNRDSDGVINPDRLDSTVVSLELTGQQAANTLFDISSTQKASSPEEGGRIAGCRFAVGWYDWVDHLSTGLGPAEADLFHHRGDAAEHVGVGGLGEVAQGVDHQRHADTVVKRLAHVGLAAGHDLEGGSGHHRVSQPHASLFHLFLRGQADVDVHVLLLHQLLLLFWPE